MEFWHSKTAAEVFATLNSNEQGLTQDEATRRLSEYGRNKLPLAKPDGFVKIFFRQFRSPLIYILMGAAATVFLMGETIDAGIIFFVLLFNAVVGAIQEGKAQNTLAALKKFIETDATVLRDGREAVIPDEEVVPGDMLILQEGDKVPADARIVIANNLKADEAALTGESEPVNKIPDRIAKEEAAVADQKNMAFKGTHIVAGNGVAIAVTTGEATFIGGISKKIGAMESAIPLQAEIAKLSKTIIFAVAGIGSVLFVSGLMLGKMPREMFATVVSLSVSIIPEGLPIVMTLVLAAGVWRMSKRNALVKKLQAIEALGQAQVILVDKTGTITKNELMVEKAYVDGKLFSIGGAGYEPKGEVSLDGAAIDPLNHPELLFLGKLAVFCANARVAFLEETKQWKALGDPTEAALFVFGQKLGFRKDEVEKEFPKLAELPFDYKLKYHATLHRVGEKNAFVIIGAPEVVLGLSDKLWLCRSEEPFAAESITFSKEKKDEFEKVFEKFSREGLRVLGVAVHYGAGAELAPEHLKHLTFAGLVGMKDVLRPEAHEALARARDAGIRVAMITGDHKRTAEAIAKESGIWREGDEALTGEEVDKIPDDELARIVGRVSVFARVTPEHKLRIVQAFKARKEIVAMTGDGVNDALSLVAADLGVAMGKIGTEVAKEAADIVLLDDNFGSIVSAVEEGRNIYKTIRKVILYLFSTSVGETLTIAGGLFLGLPLPVLPAQIIWLNLVTDGFLDVALAMEPKDDSLLKPNFKQSGRRLIDGPMFMRGLFMALPMMIGTLLLFSIYLADSPGKALTVSLTVLAVFQWLNAWNCRHESKSLFAMNPFSNPYLIGATGMVILLQLFAVYNPFMQQVLHTTPLALWDWVVIVMVATSVILVEEARKFVSRLILSR